MQFSRTAVDQKVREEAAIRTVLEVQKMEKEIDRAIEKLDNLSESDLQKMRQKRLHELKNKSTREAELRKKGHGTYSEIADQKAFFDEVKSSDRVICHFYRESTWRCGIVDKHFQQLAPKHLETKFIKIDAEKSPFLCERLNVTVLPTIVMTKDAHTQDRLVGFDELGGKDNFTTEMLERRLAKKGMIDYEEPSKPPEGFIKKPTSSENPTGSSIYKSRLNAMLQEDWDDEEEDQDADERQLEGILAAKDANGTANNSNNSTDSKAQTQTSSDSSKSASTSATDNGAKPTVTAATST